MLSSVKISTVAGKSAKGNMKKFTSPGLRNRTGWFGFLVVGALAWLVVMTANISRAQPTIPSGYFQFTTPAYSVSDREDDGTLDSGGSVTPSLNGARVTVARFGGSSGRVIVPVVTMILTNFSLTTIDITTNGVAETNVPIAFPTNIPIPDVTNTLVFDDYQMSASLLLPTYECGTNITAGPTNAEPRPRQLPPILFIPIQSFRCPNSLIRRRWIRWNLPI